MSCTLRLRRLGLAALLVCAAAVGAEPADPLAAVYGAELQSTVQNLIDHHRAHRKYSTADFPLAAEEFGAFREEVVSNLVVALGLEHWAVREPRGKVSPIGELFRDRVVSRMTWDGVQIEAHVIEILETGDRVPAVLCLPAGREPRPGIACYPGHGKNPLRDLVFDPESYQRAIAVKLAQAGFASIAVEKIDTGYLARSAPSGIDEEAIVGFRLGAGVTTRAAQLMANLAALEILAAHPRVDETRMGATGVSLGGWLAMQTALLSDRVGAVAEYAMKTVFLADEAEAEDFGGVKDLCHIIPGTFTLGDRNVLMFPWAPRPLLSGHGGPKDKGSHSQYARYYRDVYEAQYEALGKPENFRYHIHDDGHTTSPAAVIEFFKEVLGP